MSWIYPSFVLTCQDAARLEHARVRAVRELLGEVQRLDRARLAVRPRRRGAALEPALERARELGARAEVLHAELLGVRARAQDAARVQRLAVRAAPEPRLAKKSC